MLSLRVLHLLRLRQRFQMRVQQRYLGIAPGRHVVWNHACGGHSHAGRGHNLYLHLRLKMDRVVLRLLPGKLRLMSSARSIDLRPRLHGHRDQDCRQR